MPEWLSFSWFSIDTLFSYSWAHSFFLWGIVLIPVLFFLRQVFNSRASNKLHLSIPENYMRHTSWVSYLRFIVPFFASVSLALVFLALARPQRSLQSEEEMTEGVNLVLAIDISESMTATDLKPTRLDAALNVANSFLENRRNDKLSLVVFAGEAKTLCPLTTDYDLLRSFLKEVKPSLVTASGTALGNAIATSINRLRAISSESKAIILLSDGDNTAGELGPDTAAELALSFGIRIYAIAIGSSTSEIKVDTRALKQTSQVTNGQFFQANNNQDLSQIFSVIDRLEKEHFELQMTKEVKDYYAIYLNWAIVFFLITLLLKNTFLGNALVD